MEPRRTPRAHVVAPFFAPGETDAVASPRPVFSTSSSLASIDGPAAGGGTLDASSTYGPGGVVITSGASPTPPSGKGTPMAEFVGIAYEITKRKAADATLQGFHAIVYGRTTRKHLKRDLLAFRGFVFPEGEENADRKQKEVDTILTRFHRCTVPLIRDLAKLLHLSVSGTKEETVDRIFQFISLPKEEKLNVASTKILTKKRKSKVAKRKKVTKKRKTVAKKKTTAGSKKNKSSEEEVDDDDEDEEEEEESSEESESESEPEDDSDDEDYDSSEKKPAKKKTKKPTKKAAVKKTATTKVKKQSATQSDSTQFISEEFIEESDNESDGDESTKEIEAELANFGGEEEKHVKKESSCGRPTKDAIRAETIRIVSNGNLDTLTMRNIRNQLQDSIFSGKELNPDEKELVKTTVNEYISQA